MRTDQWMGLNERGQDFIDTYKEKCVVTTTKVFLNSPEIEIEREETCYDFPPTLDLTWRMVEGAFGLPAGWLMSFTIYEDGKAITVKEEIQEEIWSSGPMYFVAVKVDDEWVEDTLWTQEELESEE